MKRPPLAALGAVALTAIVLSGCAASPGAASPSSSTPTSTPIATSPSPSAPPEAAAPVTCESLVDDADEAKYAAAGWTLSGDYEQRVVDGPLPTLPFLTYGGVLCQWGPKGTDAGSVYGYSPITPAEAETQKSRLLAEGYSATSDLGGSYFEGHGDVSLGEDADLFYLFLDDAWYHTTVNRDAIEKMVRNVEAL